MTVSLIWAEARNRVIGRDGTLPWHLPEDMGRFRELTMGSTVVMGRRTWESLPDRFRPLPGRRNVVLTHDLSYDADGATVVHSLADAVATAEDVWVIGGAAVYADALSYAEQIVRTDIDTTLDGDAFAPTIDDTWHETDRDPAIGWHTSSTGLRYRWTTFRKSRGSR